MKAFAGRAASGRMDWPAERDRIDLPAVAIGLLGPPPGRRGEGGPGLWWRCPFHVDRNPSFKIDPGKLWWRCYGCGAYGDAASLVMRLDGLSFPEALARLTGRPSPSGAPRTLPTPGARPRPEPSPEGPKGMPEPAALALVAEAEARLWSPEGAEALAYLTGRRCLSLTTIRAARLGWTRGVQVPKQGGGTFRPRGVVIPWFDGDRLALVKIRKPDGAGPKYVEAFRDRPTLYPGPRIIRPGHPLVLVEGEFDALLLGQDLGELAAVVTLGSASGRHDAARKFMRPAAPWYIATDADPAGDQAANGWPARARRVRPPEPFKDWTEARQAGVNLRRWWTDRLGGNEATPLFTWDDLACWRWGPAIGDPEPGIIIDRPDPARRRLALEALGDGPDV